MCRITRFDGAVLSQCQLLPVDSEKPEPEVIARAASVLRSGGLVAFPTETVYGLGGKIGVSTNPGRFTRFKIVLPAEAASSAVA